MHGICSVLHFQYSYKLHLVFFIIIFIIRGIKLPGNLQKIVGGEFYKEYTSYCYKDIRGIKLQGRVSKGYH